MKDLTIAIVGAGIGGLTAALGLQRAGFRVTRLRTGAAAGEVGAGLSLSPTRRTACARSASARCSRARPTRPRTSACATAGRPAADAGSTVAAALIEKYGERYYLIHRADLHEGLVRRRRAPTIPKAIRAEPSAARDRAQTGTAV
jgi:salicylate hydroxylase